MVETFVIEDTKTLIYDNEQLDQWLEKCKFLGLENQLTLSEKDKSPIPFEFMNQSMKRVYETLCPEKVELNRYDKTPIPLEVLGLIELAKREGYFDKIEIWYDDKAPDPLAVGYKYKGPKSESWNSDKYTMARWGDVLRPFNELKALAVERFTHTKRIELNRTIASSKQQLETINIDVAAHFDCQVSISNSELSLF